MAGVAVVDKVVGPQTRIGGAEGAHPDWAVKALKALENLEALDRRIRLPFGQLLGRIYLQKLHNSYF